MRLTDRGAAILAWSACGLTVAMAVSTVVFGIIDHGSRLPSPERGEVNAAGNAGFAAMTVTFSVLGALVASRRPRNPIGWILCLAPVALGFTQVARDLYTHTLSADPGSLPLADGLMWAANWAWVPGFMPLLTLLLLLFPDGRPPSPRWRPVGWLALLAMTLLIVGFGLAPGALEDYPRVDNPIGVEGAVEGPLEAFKFLGFLLFSLAAIGSMASLVTRFRRSRGEQRQQLRWMAAAAALVVVAWMVNSFFDQALDIDVSFVLLIAAFSLPVATAVAVLRYRLYDLGLVINRALVYGGLSATLVGAYLGSVLLFQLVLSPESDIAIAGSTLAVAALFGPARRRIQALVDRRFYRRRYDAAQTIAAFSARLRDEVELDALNNELGNVVRETMQPAHVSLWLRNAG